MTSGLHDLYISDGSCEARAILRMLSCKTCHRSPHGFERGQAVNCRQARMGIGMGDGVIQETVMFLMRPWIGSCKKTMARLSGHLEQDLPPRQERRVRRHLMRCHRCRSAFESLARAVERVRMLGRHDLHEPTPSVVNVVTERVRQDQRS